MVAQPKRLGAWNHDELRLPNDGRVVIDLSSGGTLRPRRGLFGLTRDHWILVGSGLLVTVLVVAFFAPQRAHRARVTEYGMVVDQTDEINRRTTAAHVRSEAIARMEALRNSELQQLAERSLALAAVDEEYFSDADRQFFADMSRDFSDFAGQYGSVNTAPTAKLAPKEDLRAIKRIPDFEVNRVVLRDANDERVAARDRYQQASAQLAEREDRDRMMDAAVAARSQQLGVLAAGLPDRAAAIIPEHGTEDAVLAELWAAANEAATLAAKEDVPLAELFATIERFSAQARQAVQRREAGDRPVFGGEMHYRAPMAVNPDDDGVPAIPEVVEPPIPGVVGPSIPEDDSPELEGSETGGPAEFQPEAAVEADQLIPQQLHHRGIAADPSIFARFTG